MTVVKLSRKNQIVVPREAREALRLRPGARLLVVAMGDHVILRRRPRSYAEALERMGAGLYPAGYLRSERKSWR
jgi:AbrB family looped-hinge helix DNA binding protein